MRDAACQSGQEIIGFGRKMRDAVIERYMEQDTRRLDEIEAHLVQIVTELGKLREMVEAALQMVMVVQERED